MPTLIADGREFKIHQDVWLEWRRLADPFETPDDVLRRVLEVGRMPHDSDTATRVDGESPTPLAPPKAKKKRRRTRASSDSILAETEYELPMLSVLESNGGRMPTREVIEAVGKIVDSKLTPVDREPLREGGPPRWHNRVQFTRLRLVKAGLMKPDSPRGVWEISADGEKRVKAASR